MNQCFHTVIVGLLLFLVLGTVQGERLRSSLPNEQAVPPKDLSADPPTVPKKTIDDMHCEYFTQPLNHFLPRGTGPTYQQRYCYYYDYVPSTKDFDEAPIFFYTGNESPLEVYVNHTGLMWELAPDVEARIVFAEHRYEGLSFPDASVDLNCMSYASTIQALADYADLIQRKLNPKGTAPVIVFGGSYGGMLSAWIRMKYPHLVHGAIAGSAPLGGFPQVANRQMDWAYRVITHGMQQSYPPDKYLRKGLDQDDPPSIKTARDRNLVTQDEGEENHCVDNLLAVWPLLQWLAQSEADQSGFLQENLGLCEAYSSEDAQPLIDFASSIWFLLAEGSFPYPSNYIPAAIIHKPDNLPAWPLQAACWKTPLHQDWGVSFKGSKENVAYNISYGDSGLTLQVDWDQVEQVSSSEPLVFAPKDARSSKTLVGLLDSLRQSIGTWYNITHDISCYNVSDLAPNRLSTSRRRRRTPSSQTKSAMDSSISPLIKSPGAQCQEYMRRVGSWEPLCCNDEMNLIIVEASGLGNDFYWPPSLPQNIQTYEDLVQNSTFEPCPDPYDIYGYSKEEPDPWSWWLETYYGCSKLTKSKHSNIIFSNGLLDPWAAGGIYKEHPFAMNKPYHGPMLQQISEENDLIALLIEHGGHHTDLMYGDPEDPQDVVWARNIERKYISKWISEFQSERCSA